MSDSQNKKSQKSLLDSQKLNSQKKDVQDNVLPKKDSQQELVCIGKFGKAVGIFGEIKVILDTDFPNSIKPQMTLYTSCKAMPTLRVKNFSLATEENQAKISFEEISNREQAQILTNHALFSSISDSRQNCELGENEFFWFDIVGCEIVENEQILGVVDEILRLANTDYLQILTNQNLPTQCPDSQKQNKNPKKSTTPALPKTFLIPYIQHYIIDVHLPSRRIFTQGALQILQNS